MQNPEEPNAEQEPNAEHHVAKVLVEVLILRSICGPLKRKLMAFSCHIQLSRVPPRCVMLWRSPEMNFTRLPRVAKLFCIGSPLNRSRGVTYCNQRCCDFNGIFDTHRNCVRRENIWSWVDVEVQILPGS